MQDLIHRPDIHVTTIETQTDISLDCSYNSLRSITTYAQDGSNSRRFEYTFEDSTRYKSPSKCKKSFSRHKSAKRIYKEYNKRKVSVVNNLHYISVRYY